MLRPRLHQQCPRTIFQGQRRKPQRKNVIRPCCPRPQDYAELAPKQEKQDFGEDVKHDEPTQRQRAEAPAQSPEAKETMVAEPLDRGYGQHHKLNIPLVICDCKIASVGNLRTGGLKL